MSRRTLAAIAGTIIAAGVARFAWTHAVQGGLISAYRYDMRLHDSLRRAKQRGASWEMNDGTFWSPPFRPGDITAAPLLGQPEGEEDILAVKSG